MYFQEDTDTMYVLWANKILLKDTDISISFYVLQNIVFLSI